MAGNGIVSGKLSLTEAELAEQDILLNTLKQQQPQYTRSSWEKISLDSKGRPNSGLIFIYSYPK